MAIKFEGAFYHNPFQAALTELLLVEYNSANNLIRKAFEMNRISGAEYAQLHEMNRLGYWNQVVAVRNMVEQFTFSLQVTP